MWHSDKTESSQNSNILTYYQLTRRKETVSDRFFATSQLFVVAVAQ